MGCNFVTSIAHKPFLQQHSEELVATTTTNDRSRGVRRMRWKGGGRRRWPVFLSLSFSLSLSSISFRLYPSILSVCVSLQLPPIRLSSFLRPRVSMLSLGFVDSLPLIKFEPGTAVGVMRVTLSLTSPASALPRQNVYRRPSVYRAHFTRRKHTPCPRRSIVRDVGVHAGVCLNIFQFFVYRFSFTYNTRNCLKIRHTRLIFSLKTLWLISAVRYPRQSYGACAIHSFRMPKGKH